MCFTDVVVKEKLPIRKNGIVISEFQIVVLPSIGVFQRPEHDKRKINGIAALPDRQCNMSQFFIQNTPRKFNIVIFVLFNDQISIIK